MATFINIRTTDYLNFQKLKVRLNLCIYKLIDLYRINVFALPLLLDNPS